MKPNTNKVSAPKSTTYYHPEADSIISVELPVIKQRINSFAIELAEQERPKESESSMLYQPKIQGLFQSLLETVFKMIGAFAVLTNTGVEILEAFKQEVKQLKDRQKELLEDLRLLKSEVKNKENLTHIFKKWNLWKWVLVGLCGAETMANFKIFLLLTPNMISALVASVGVALSLFIISHTFKDVINYFSSNLLKWISGIGITAFVVILLYGFASLRVLFMNGEESFSEPPSVWNFVVLNILLWGAGTIVCMIYKPLKSTVDKYEKFQQTNKKIVEIKKELDTIRLRLEAIPNEQSQALLDIDNLKSMAKHYEQIISVEYTTTVADFKSENLFRRKDNVQPKAFLETPSPLTTYFDHIVYPNSKN